MNLAFLLPVAALALMTAVAGFAWWFMARRPAQWAAWVDRENDFWRAKGLVSASLVERMKRWEKGRVIKFLAALTTLVAAIGLGLTTMVLVKVVSLEHQRLRMPHIPVWPVKPTNQPPAKPAAPGTASKDAKK